MLIELSTNEWRALAAVIAESASDPVAQPQPIEHGYLLNLSDVLADEYRNRCQDHLEIIGFDKDYHPTGQGRILESLIDKLYIG